MVNPWGASREESLIPTSQIKKLRLSRALTSRYKSLTPNFFVVPPCSHFNDHTQKCPGDHVYSGTKPACKAIVL